MSALPDALACLLAGQPPPGASLHIDGPGPPLVLRADKREAWLGPAPIAGVGRSATGFRLLLVAATRGAALDRAALFRQVWEERYRGSSSDNRLRVALSRLRKALPAGLGLAATAGGGLRLADPRAVWTLSDPGPAPGARPVEAWGRDALVAQLADRTEPVLVLVGPGGVGKSTVARGLVAARPDRWSCFVPMDGVGEVDAGWCAVATALGLPRPAQARDRVRAALAPRRARLVLDGVDGLAGPALAGLVEALVDAGAQVVLTRRAPPGLPGAHRVAVEGLPVDAGVRLYEARLHQLGHTPTPAQRPAVRQLVDALDGLPLAIELAARRAAVLPASALLRRSDQLLHLLRDGDSSLRAAWRESWAGLAPGTRVLLARTAVLPAGFSVELAEALLPAPHRDDIFDLLQEALERGLLRRTGERLRPLGTLRQYALAHLDDVASAEQLAAAALSDRAEAWVAALDGPDAAWGLSALDAERANLLALHRRCTGALRYRLGLGICSLVLLRGSVPQPLRVLAESIAAAPSGAPTDRLRCGRAQVLQMRGDVEAALTELDLEEGPEVGRVRCMTLTAAGRLDEAVAALDYTPWDALSEARWLEARGVVRIRVPDPAGAAADLGRALSLYAGLGNVRAEGRVAANLADVHISAGDFREGLGRAQRAVEAARRSGDTVALCYGLANVGLCRVELGEGGEAELTEALPLARGLGHRAVIDGVAALLRRVRGA